MYTHMTERETESSSSKCSSSMDNDSCSDGETRPNLSLNRCGAVELFKLGAPVRASSALPRIILSAHAGVRVNTAGSEFGSHTRAFACLSGFVELP